MPMDTFHKKNYIQYRWTVEQNRYDRRATIYQQLNLVTTLLAVAAVAAALILIPLYPMLQMPLFGLALVAIAMNVVYDFRDRARRYRGVADALRREREMYEANAGAYTHEDKAFSRFVRRCELILQSGGDNYLPLIVEPEDEPESPSSPASPFGRSSSVATLRSRLTSSRFGSVASRSDSDDDEDDDDDDDEDDEGDDTRRTRSRFGDNPFSRTSGSSSLGRTGSNPFGSRSTGSPFGSSARFGGGRPIGSSGGMRREGNDDPALSGIQTGNGHSGVRFSAYYPKEMLPNEWHPLKAYAFMGYALDSTSVDAEGGDPDKVPEILYDRNRTARYRIPEGAQVTVTPHMKDFQFNPQSVSIGFYRTWHRFDFEIRAMAANLDEATNGYLTFTVDGLVVADVPVSVYVARGLSREAREATRRVTRKPYRAVYASFANEDLYLAERLRRVYDALGMYSMRDLMQLRAENGWTDDMLEAVKTAEVFQLFWSGAAANSENVRRELEQALEQAGSADNYIRAVYWEHPPAALPDLLSHIEPEYLPDIAE